MEKRLDEAPGAVLDRDRTRGCLAKLQTTHVRILMQPIWSRIQQLPRCICDGVGLRPTLVDQIDDPLADRHVLGADVHRDHNRAPAIGVNLNVREHGAGATAVGVDRAAL